MPLPSPSEALPTAVRLVVDASLRFLVRTDEVAVRASESAERLRATAAMIPRPRREYDEL